MSENRCVSCGDIIPEGKMICRKCEEGNKTPTIEFKNTTVFGFDHAFRGMRKVYGDYRYSGTKISIWKNANNPMINIKRGELNECFRIDGDIIYVKIDPVDIELAQALIDEGVQYTEGLNLIHVQADISKINGTDFLDTNYGILREKYKTLDPENETDAIWLKWIASLPYAEELICYGQ